MRLGPLRAGELLALVASVGLFALLFFDWFGLAFAQPEPQFDGGGILNLLATHTAVKFDGSGWGALGWLMDVLLCVLIAGGLVLAYATLRRASPAWALGAATLTTVGGLVIVLILAVRVLTLGDDSSGPVHVTVQAPAYLGLLFAALIPAGALMALRDERVDAPESAYTPPPARPVPGT